MNPYTIGIVCEGPTDSFVLERLVESIQKNQNKCLKAVTLAPSEDATTRKTPPWGWTNVRAWCRQYSAAGGSDGGELARDMGFDHERLKSYSATHSWRALIAIGQVDGLVIQIDADIAPEIGNGRRAEVDAFDPMRDDRSCYCKNAVLAWLGEEACTDELYVLVTAYALETWFLALYDKASNPEMFDTQPANYQELTNVVELLLQAGWGRRKGGISKNIKQYSRRIEPLLNNLSIVRSRCPALDDFVQFLLAKDDCDEECSCKPCSLK